MLAHQLTGVKDTLEKRQSLQQMGFFSATHFDGEVDQSMFPKETVCLQCDELKTEIGKLEAKNGKLAASLAETQQNLNEVERFYDDLSLRHEKLNFKRVEVGRCCELLQTAIPVLNSSQLAGYLSELSVFLESDSIKMRWDALPPNPVAQPTLSAVRERAAEAHETMTALETLEQEMEKFSQLVEQFHEEIRSPSVSQSVDVSQNKSKDNEKSREEKKKKYFNRIWEMG
jgi:hypothetical protein